MANEEIITDDYVASLLSREAKDCSIKYSAMGVDAFLSKSSKKPENIPKPNTRFLRNIIKGTDMHNKALLAKEAAESKARLQRLERTDETKRKKINPTTKDIRERHMGDIQAILGGGRRRRRDAQDAELKGAESRDRGNAKCRGGSNQSEEYQDEVNRSGQSSPNRHSDGSRRHHISRVAASRSRKSRHKDHSSDDELHSRQRMCSRNDRSRSPGSSLRDERRRKEDSEHRHYRHRSPRRRRPSSASGKMPLADSLNDLEDDIIGPVLPPKIRGRGAIGPSSGIDRRFSASYDPKTDIQGDEEYNT